MNAQIRPTSPNTRRISLAFALLAVALGVSTLGACNTTKGVGRDVQSAGRGVERAATDVQRNL